MVQPFFVSLLSLLPSALQPSSIPFPQPPAHFAFVLERTETGVSAFCIEGCDWERVSFNCSGSCEILLDASAMSSARTRREVGGFVIVFQLQETGWTARSYLGTAWETLGVTCERLPCRSRVTELGVRGP